MLKMISVNIFEEFMEVLDQIERLLENGRFNACPGLKGP